MEFSNKNILITGGAGFLGQRLINKLKIKYNIFSYDIQDNYNILDIKQLDELFSSFKPNIVIHLAAIADLNIFAKNPDYGYKINVKGTRNILDMCKKFNSRLLFASTCCCYGNNDTHPSDETSPICPTEPYAESKKISETDIVPLGLPHCCMRLATFYGPEMRPALAPAIFLDKIHRKEEVEIHGTGEQTRTLTYVDDIVSGICTIVENEPKYNIINITTEESVSVLDMIKYSEELTGNKANCKFVDDRKGQIYKEVILSNRLQSLGWKPSCTTKEGFKKSYEYYLENRNKW